MHLDDGHRPTAMPLITGPVGISRDAAMRLLAQNKIEKLPLVIYQGRLKGSLRDHAQGLREVRAGRTPFISIRRIQR